MYSSGLTSNFFSIDGSTKELGFVSDQPNAILVPNVVRNVLTTGSDSNYTFSFKSTNPLPFGGFVIVTFPT